MLSLNKLHGSGRSSYVVSCELPDGNDHHVLKSKKFECRGVEDLGAQANAVRFAKAAETVPEFRAFLFGSETDGFGRDQRIRVRSYVCMREKQLTGVRYGVAMCRLESGQLRSISFFRGTASDEVAGAKGEEQVLEKAEQFLRSVAFENWRRQVSRESLLKNREQAAGSTHNLGKERGLKHPHSFVEIDQGEKVDCKCGKNRSHGLMMACERCGAWEHAECQGFRSDKQIPADYICSACVRAEREEVTIIRCEEQVYTLEVKGRALCRDNFKRTSDIEKGKLWSMNLEDAHAGMAVRDNDHICCLCGCEDNEYFEPLVQPCSCAGCSVLAHTSCITTMKVGASYREQRLQRSGVCCLCGSSDKDNVVNDTKLQKGGRWVEDPDSGSTKLGKGDQQGVARKRLRSTTGGSTVPGKLELGEKPPAKSSRNEKVPNTVQVEKVQPEASPTDVKKSGSPFLGRRFSDAAANVPIKKRRIQLEMARSPSPPPGNLKLQSEIPLVHEVLVVTKLSNSSSSEEVNVTDADSDGNGSGSQKSLEAAQVQKIDSKASVAALNIPEATEFIVTVPGTDTEEGTVVGRSTQLVGCKSEKGEGRSPQRKGNRCVAENGTSPANNRSKEGGNLVSQVDVQQQQISPVHAASTTPSSEREQACAVESAVESKTGRAGIQSEDILSDPSREGRASPSPNSKRKYSETDMGYPARDHLGEDEPSRSRPGNRAGHVNFQTSVAGGTGVDVGGLAQEGSAMVKAASLAGINNNLRDDRLHWDLNMDMEEWERPTVEDSAGATARNSSLPNARVEKRKSLHGKEIAQESHKIEPGVADGTSTSFEDGRLEKCPLLDSADAVREVNAAVARGSSPKLEMLVESKDEISLKPCDVCSRMAEDQRRSISSPGCTHAAKQHDYPEDKPEVPCNILPDDRSTSALNKDNHYRELEISPAPDQKAEVRHIEEAPSMVGPIVDKETKGKVFLVADQGRTDFDHCSSGPTDVRADTTCVNADEDICDTQGVKELADDPSAAVDAVQSEKQPEYHSENLSQIGHSENLIIPTFEPTSVPVTKISPTRNVTDPQRCDEDEGARHEDENLVDKEVVEEFMNNRNRSSASPSRQPATIKWEGDNGEDLEAEDVDYGDSDMREGDDLDVEDRLQRGAAEAESTWNPCDDTKISEVQDGSRSPDASGSQDGSASPSHRGDADGLSTMMGSPVPSRKRRHESESSDAEELRGMDVEEAHPVNVEDPNPASIPAKGSLNSEMNGRLVVEEDKVGDDHGNGSASVATSDSHRTSSERAEDLTGTARSGKDRKSEVWREPSEGSCRARSKSGWDQLPEGFQSAEEALQAARSNAGQTGWGSHYGGPGYSGWSGNSSMHFNSGDNRFLPGHGRGMLPGPAADRGPFDKTAWSRGDHPRRSRMDVGMEMHGRVPVNQELRHSSGSRPRPGSLEPGHRPRRPGGWVDDAGAPPPLWTYGPGRHHSPPGGPSREPFGFHPHKTRNAAAVAAAKVESSGLVVAPDGTVIKAGAGGPAPLRSIGAKGRGGGGFSSHDITSNGVMTGVGNTGLSHSLRIAGDVDLRGRECMGVDTRVPVDASFKRGERFGSSFPPGSSSMPRGVPGMLNAPSRYRWTRDERTFPPPVVQEERPLFSKRRQVETSSLPQPGSRSRLSTPPRTATSNEPVPDDSAAAQPRKSRITDTKPEVEPEVAPVEPDATQAAPPPPKLPLPPPPPRAQRSPPAGLKRLINKREVEWPRGRERSRDREREWDSSRERSGSRSHYSPSRRSSPHVIHGSALTDERDRLLLAGIDRSRDQGGASGSASAEDVQQPTSYRGRSMEDVHEGGPRRGGGRYYEKGEELLGVKSRGLSKTGDVKDLRLEADRGSRVLNENARRDCAKAGGSYKHSSSREGEDDVAPRRRRPS